MRFAVGLPIQIFVHEARQGRPETIARIVREVEDMGYWALTFAHHISDPGLSALGHAGGQRVNWRYADPIAILSYLAAVSRKSKLLPWVIVLPYRKPAELAHGLASVDAFSGGRLIFGAGAGARVSEFKLLGVPYEDRGKITDEWLEIIVELWTNPKASYQGRYHSFENVTLCVRPVQQPRPPIWIGGGSRAALRRAIKYGEVWCPPTYGFPREDSSGYGASQPRGWVTAQELKEAMAWANGQRKSLGKPPLEAAVGTGIPVRFKDKPRPGPRRSRKDVTYFTSEGTPEELIEEFAAFREAGASYFVAKFTGETPKEYLADAERFAAKVMPAFLSP